MQCNLAASRRGFTVIELMIVIAIIALLAAVAASALSNAAEQARAQRTRAIINKIDQLIMEKYDSYRTRAIPLQMPNGTSPYRAAEIRLHAIRDLMRMEMPDRKTDLTDGPADLNPYSATTLSLASPSVRNGYIRRITAACGSSWQDNTTGWTPASQGAECLYLILSMMRDGEQSSLDYFTSAEVGDLDGDGMPEILDGWGKPIEFLRWAPGFVIDPDSAWKEVPSFVPLTTQTRDASVSPDPFDPLKIQGQYALTPLIFSAGPDGEFDVFTDNDLPNYQQYAKSGPNNYPKPYNSFDDGKWAGQIFDRDKDGYHAYQDNITNHFRGDQ